MGQYNYPFFSDVSRVGQVETSFPHEIISLVNNSGRTAQVDTITVNTATNSHTYTLKIDGVTISYTADSATSESEVAIGLAAAINAEPLVNGRVSAADSTADCVITARTAGVGFTTSDVDAKCTLVNTTANASSSTLAFGAAVVEDGTTAEKCKIASSANMTAQVVNCTPLHVNSTVYQIGIEVDGVGYLFETTSDGSATVQEIVEALAPIIEAQMPASTVAATEDNTKIILTGEVAGKNFKVSVGSSGVSATWTVAKTYADQVVDFNLAIRGIAAYVLNQEVSSSNTMVYAANSVVNVLKKGRIWVETAAAITPAKPVYIGVASTAVGKFTGAATSNYVLLDPNKFRWVKADGSSRGLLEVNL